jgi:uncharacterized phage-associated protein
MLDPLQVAQYFIIRAYQDGREADMTNMKVQKLLYYTQCLHLALFDEPLITDEIQAWRYGPVCPPAYGYYSEFEAKQLPIPRLSDLKHISQEVKDLLEEVWDYFGIHHAYVLSSMTHLEFPWKKARHGLPSQASCTEPIAQGDMRLLGKEKLLEIEQENPLYAPIISHIVEKALTPSLKTKTIQKGEVGDWLTSLLP